METLHIAEATDEIMTVLRRLNKYIDETMPWALAKDETKKERLGTVLYNLIEGIRICAVMLYPFIPESAEKIMGELTHPENTEKLSLEDWKNASEFGHAYANGSRVNPAPTPLFMRIDEKEFMAKLEADRKAAEKADKAAKKEEKKAEEPEVTEIGIEDFLKVRRICAQILECEPVPKSDKL